MTLDEIPRRQDGQAQPHLPHGRGSSQHMLAIEAQQKLRGPLNRCGQDMGILGSDVRRCTAPQLIAAQNLRWRHGQKLPRDLGQVQMDKLRVKIQGAILWLAMALQVSTRLWLGGALGEQRNFPLIVSLLQKVRRCALCRPLLFCSDGFKAYVHLSPRKAAIQQVFREALPSGRRGRPLLRPWDCGELHRR